MNALFLSAHPTVSIFFREAGPLLFGALMMLLSAALVFAAYLKQITSAAYWFVACLCVSLVLLCGIIALDFAGASGPVFEEMTQSGLSALFATHRFVLLQVPILFLSTALGLGLVCKNHLGQAHASSYVFLMRFCTVMSFGTLILMGYESLI